MGKYVGKNALTAFWNGIKAMFSDVAFSGDADDVSYDNTDSGLSATDVQGAVDELEDEFSKTFKIKYKNTNWSTIHSFPVETVNRIGLILTHDGTLYSFVQYASTGNFSITKLAGTHTITASVQDGYNRLSIDASVGIIVVTI